MAQVSRILTHSPMGTVSLLINKVRLRSRSNPIMLLPSMLNIHPPHSSSPQLNLALRKCHHNNTHPLRRLCRSARWELIHHQYHFSNNNKYSEPKPLHKLAPFPPAHLAYLLLLAYPNVQVLARP